jgi:hypothetical protein
LSPRVLFVHIWHASTWFVNLCFRLPQFRFVFSVAELLEARFYDVSVWLDKTWFLAVGIGLHPDGKYFIFEELPAARILSGHVWVCDFRIFNVSARFCSLWLSFLVAKLLPLRVDDIDIRHVATGILIVAA